MKTKPSNLRARTADGKIVTGPEAIRLMSKGEATLVRDMQSSEGGPERAVGRPQVRPSL